MPAEFFASGSGWTSPGWFMDSRPATREIFACFDRSTPLFPVWEQKA